MCLIVQPTLKMDCSLSPHSLFLSVSVLALSFFLCPFFFALLFLVSFRRLPLIRLTADIFSYPVSDFVCVSMSYRLLNL